MDGTHTPWWLVLPVLVIEMLGVAFVTPRVVAAFGGHGDDGAAPPPGRWREAPLTDADVVAPRADRGAEARELEAIGYRSGYEPPRGADGVVVLDRARAAPGWTLLNSGDGPRAELVDLDGHVVHTWSMPWSRAFPDADPHLLQPEEGHDPAGREAWRRVHLLPDGSLLAIHEGWGMVRVDKDSRLVWARRNGAHHDLAVADDGRIWTLARDARIHPDLRDGPILEDYVVTMTPDGEEVDRFSLLEALRASDHAALLQFAPKDHGDWLHTNAIELLDGSAEAEAGPAFAKGNLLVSWPWLDTVAIVDPAKRRVVWAMTGRWVFQHDPEPLPDGHVVVLDNRGPGRFSRLIEVDPRTQEVAWTWDGATHGGFSTESCGALDHLPNGDLLVTESDSGRALELDRDGRVVWAWHSPLRAGAHGELVATLFEAQRIPYAATAAWRSR